MVVWRCFQRLRLKLLAVTNNLPYDEILDNIPSHVPQVDRDDVIRIVCREFVPEDQQCVIRILDQYGTETWHPEQNRVQISALKVCNRDILRLRECIEEARSDFRGIVARAEYPEFWTVGLSDIKNMSLRQVLKLVENDWDQYQSWLCRTQ